VYESYQPVAKNMYIRGKKRGARLPDARHAALAVAEAQLPVVEAVAVGGALPLTGARLPILSVRGELQPGQ
jgi:hypothetical protein